jgi:hypothetical protein
VRSESVVDGDERRFRDADHRGAPPGGTRQLAAILPNGRTVWLRVDRPLAPAASVNHVGRLAEQLAERRQAEIAARAGETERLSTVVAADIERLEETRIARVRAFRRRIAAGHNTLDARLAKARDELRSRLDAQLKIDRENLRRLRRRELWDKILLATSLPLFAAYGERRNPLGSNNLTLVFLLLIWLVGDQVVEAVFGTDSGKSKYALADADAWSYLAPIGNVLAAWWLLGDRQHKRFVTGVTTITLEKKEPQVGSGTVFYRYHATVDLSGEIGKDHFADFATFSGVPVVATIASIRLSSDGVSVDPEIEALRAKVEDGVLKLSFRAVPRNASLPMPSSLGELDIAWMVDTDNPSAPERRS